jgi:hypothetical protein
MWVLRMELAACHPSVASTFTVASRFLENLWPLTYSIPCAVSNQYDLHEALSALIFSSLSNGNNLLVMLDNFLKICTINMLIGLMPRHQMYISLLVFPTLVTKFNTLAPYH